MIFNETPLKGAYTIDLAPINDDRGFFARTFSRADFLDRGMNPDFVQCNLSYNPTRGTLRGMHYQEKPHMENKLIRCTRGSIFDVIVDIRPDSPTRNQWFGAVLSADNRRAMFCPEGFAHGYLTLEDDSEVFYQVSAVYCAEAARSLRWDDPAFNIEWPFKPVLMSEKDANAKLLQLV